MVKGIAKKIFKSSLLIGNNMKFKPDDYNGFIKMINEEFKNRNSKLEIYTGFTEPDELLEVIVYRVKMKEFDPFIDNKKYDSGFGLLHLNDDYKKFIKEKCKEYFNREPVFTLFENSFWVRREAMPG